jgi:hypothetical protein
MGIITILSPPQGKSLFSLGIIKKIENISFINHFLAIKSIKTSVAFNLLFLFTFNELP